MTQFEKFKHIILGADYLKSSNLLTGMVGIQTLVSDWYYIKHLNFRYCFFLIVDNILQRHFLCIRSELPLSM